MPEHAAPVGPSAPQAAAHHRVSGEHEPDAAQAQKAQIPRELSAARVDVVDAEQLVIDQPLDEVEQPPPADERSDQRLSGPRNRRPTPITHIVHVTA